MDHKGTLQNFYMRLLRISNTCTYTTSPVGPPFNATVKCPAVFLGNIQLDAVEGQATGPTKKEAEKRAAEHALTNLRKLGYDVFNPRGLPRGLPVAPDPTHLPTSPTASPAPGSILNPPASHPPINPKVYLNEFFQKALRVSKCLSYTVNSHNGQLRCLLETPPLVDHTGSELFSAETFVGTGTTKAEAEGAAAKQALVKLVEKNLVDRALPPLPPLGRFTLYNMMGPFPPTASPPTSPHPYAPHPRSTPSTMEPSTPSGQDYSPHSHSTSEYPSHPIEPVHGYVPPAILTRPQPSYPSPNVTPVELQCYYTCIVPSQSPPRATHSPYQHHSNTWDGSPPRTTSPTALSSQMAQKLDLGGGGGHPTPSLHNISQLCAGSSDTQQTMLYNPQDNTHTKQAPSSRLPAPPPKPAPALKPGVYQIETVGLLEPLACPEPGEHTPPGALVAVRTNPKGTLQELYMKAVKSSGAVMFQWGHWLEGGLFGARVSCPPLDSGYLVLPMLHGEGRGRSKKGGEQNAANDVLRQLEDTYGVRRGPGGAFVVIKGNFAFVL